MFVNREESVMHEAVSPLLICAGVGGGMMRARAICAHAALKLTARLLRIYEQNNNRKKAIDVIIVVVLNLYFNFYVRIPIIND